MAVDFWQDCSILHGGIEMAGNAKNAMVNAQCAVLDTTPLSTTGWTTVVAGNKSGTFSMEFMQDVDNGSVDDTIWATLGVADTPFSFARPSADGSIAYFARTLPLSYTPIEGAPGELMMGRVSGASSSGPVVRGRLMHHPGTARTSSGTGVARQLGAVAAGQRVYANLHVLSVSGTSSPTLTVSVHSDNAVGFPSTTSRISFAGATAVGAQSGSAAGAITDDWWRAVWTISGTNPSFLFAVTVGVA